MVGRELVRTELALLTSILSRRDPDLVPVVERIGSAPLGDEERSRLRRAIVDELCELPERTSGRRALELEEILIHLGQA
ncbi:MAG TPA: hypothetical protein VGA16_00670 [Candidatus Limnocylindria bacterium]